MKTYLEKLLTTCLGQDTEDQIKLSFAHRLGPLGKGKNRSRDRERDIIIGFPQVAVKTLVLNSLWDKPKITIEDQQLTFYSDLSPLTLHKKREWNFLATKLITCGIPYCDK